MTATLSKIDRNHLKDIFEVVLTADTDTYELNIKECRGFSIATKGIASDEIKIYSSLIPSPTASDYHQILNNQGQNPFAQTNDLVDKQAGRYESLKIERVGGVDGDITVQISLSK